MSQCHHHKLRSDLPPLPPRIAALPVDERGYPVPFFVSWIKGKPEFRAADARKLVVCVKLKLCWVCGQPLGRFKCFPIGPMCAVNRNTAEPPSHLECALWSVKGCPFLSKPRMVRREDEFTASHKNEVAGVMIERNPGVTCLWTALSYERRRDGQGGILFTVGEPVSVTWWREGREATRAEVLHAICTGMPALLELCHDEKDRQECLDIQRRFEASGLLPAN